MTIRCIDIAVGWTYKRDTVVSAYELLLGPVDRPHYFELKVKGVTEGSSYKLLVNNTIVRDRYPLRPNEDHFYYNGLLYAAETLTLVGEGKIYYELKYIRKSYVN